MNDTSQPPKGSLLNTSKWVCIAFVVGVLAFGAYKAWQIFTKPAEVVGSAVDGMSGAVKSGADAVKDGTSDLYNRLQVEVTSQAGFNTLSETAFKVLNTMKPTESDGMKDRLFRASTLGGNEGRVCRMDVDFGGGEIPVFLASDNEAYATSKALGSLENRMIRVVIMAGNDDVSLNAIWNDETENWELKWKATTVRKPVSDELALSRIEDVLGRVSESCQ